MGLALVVTAVVAGLLGALAGFTTFKRSLCWCPICGATLRCVECGHLSSGATAPKPTTESGRSLTFRRPE
jgi:hypothetical protein